MKVQVYFNNIVDMEEFNATIDPGERVIQKRDKEDLDTSGDFVDLQPLAIDGVSTDYVDFNMNNVDELLHRTEALEKESAHDPDNYLIPGYDFKEDSKDRNGERPSDMPIVQENSHEDIPSIFPKSTEGCQTSTISSTLNGSTSEPLVSEAGVSGVTEVPALSDGGDSIKSMDPQDVNNSEIDLLPESPRTSQETSQETNQVATVNHNPDFQNGDSSSRKHRPTSRIFLPKKAEEENNETASELAEDPNKMRRKRSVVSYRDMIQGGLYPTKSHLAPVAVSKARKSEEQPQKRRNSQFTRGNREFPNRKSFEKFSSLSKQTSAHLKPKACDTDDGMNDSQHPPSHQSKLSMDINQASTPGFIPNCSSGLSDQVTDSPTPIPKVEPNVEDVGNASDHRKQVQVPKDFKIEVQEDLVVQPASQPMTRLQRKVSLPAKTEDLINTTRTVPGTRLIRGASGKLRLSCKRERRLHPNAITGILREPGLPRALVKIDAALEGAEVASKCATKEIQASVGTSMRKSNRDRRQKSFSSIEPNVRSEKDKISKATREEAERKEPSGSVLRRTLKVGHVQKDKSDSARDSEGADQGVADHGNSGDINEGKIIRRIPRFRPPRQKNLQKVSTAQISEASTNHDDEKSRPPLEGFPSTSKSRPCPICFFMFESEEKLSQHKEKVHPEAVSDADDDEDVSDEVEVMSVDIEDVIEGQDLTLEDNISEADLDKSFDFDLPPDDVSDAGLDHSTDLLSQDGISGLDLDHSDLPPQENISESNLDQSKDSMVSTTPSRSRMESDVEKSRQVRKPHADMKIKRRNLSSFGDNESSKQDADFMDTDEVERGDALLGSPRTRRAWKPSMKFQECLQTGEYFKAELKARQSKKASDKEDESEPEDTANVDQKKKDQDYKPSAPASVKSSPAKRKVSESPPQPQSVRMASQKVPRVVDSSISGARPGKIECGVCRSVKFYSHILQARKWGVYACEPCRKFITRSIAHGPTREFKCADHPERCGLQIPPRCPACWAFRCIQRCPQIQPHLEKAVLQKLPDKHRQMFREEGKERRFFGDCTPATLEEVHKHNYNSIIGTGLAAKKTKTRAPAECHFEQDDDNSETGRRSQGSDFDAGGQGRRSRVPRVYENDDISEAGNKKLKVVVGGRMKHSQHVAADALRKRAAKFKRGPNAPGNGRRQRTPLKLKNEVAVKRRKGPLIKTIASQKIRKNGEVLDASGEPPIRNGKGKRPGNFRGPRVKHVCRTASMVFRYPLAVKEEDELTALDQQGQGEEGLSHFLEDVSESFQDIGMEHSELEDPVKMLEAVGPDPRSSLESELAESASALAEILGEDEEDMSLKRNKKKSNQKTSNKSRSNQCPYCLKVIKRSGFMQKHILAYHTKPKCRESQEESKEVPPSGETDLSSASNAKEEEKEGKFGKMETTVDLPAKKGQVEKKHLKRKKAQVDPAFSISIDYHEAYRVEDVAKQGFAVISACHLDVDIMCYMCGSAGYYEFLFCSVCCEPFHPFCATPPPNEDEVEQNWVCSRCLTCHTCGLVSPDRTCSSCHKHYHTACLREHSGDAEGKDSKKLPKWMMECSKCCSWVHAKCEGLSDESYQILSFLPDSVEYICSVCYPLMNEGLNEEFLEPPLWKSAIEEKLYVGLTEILHKAIKWKDDMEVARLKKKEDEDALAGISFEVDESGEVRGCPEALAALISQGTGPTFKLHLSPEDETKEENMDEPMEMESKAEPSSKTLDSVEENLLEKGYRNIRAFLVDLSAALRNEAGTCSNNEAQEMCYRFTREVFSWFQPEIHLLEPQEDTGKPVKTPVASSDHIYSSHPEAVKVIPVKGVPNHKLVQTRRCLLCMQSGDDLNERADRLISCGGTIWSHVNCLLWSSEAWEDADGSLKDVSVVLTRALGICCQVCEKRGATIGCQVADCGKSFHFGCALKARCVFTHLGHCYCAPHANLARNITTDFPLIRSVHVDMESLQSADRKGLYYMAKKVADRRNVQLIIGAMRVTSLGWICSASDTEAALIPADFHMQRLFWSVEDPKKRVMYEFSSKFVPREEELSMAPEWDQNWTISHLEMSEEAIAKVWKEIEIYQEEIGRQEELLKRSEEQQKHEEEEESRRNIQVPNLKGKWGRYTQLWARTERPPEQEVILELEDLDPTEAARVLPDYIWVNAGLDPQAVREMLLRISLPQITQMEQEEKIKADGKDTPKKVRPRQRSLSPQRHVSPPHGRRSLSADSDRPKSPSCDISLSCKNCRAQEGFTVRPIHALQPIPQVDGCADSDGSEDESSSLKCPKCKSVYRTNESAQKHMATCSFEVDSSDSEAVEAMEHESSLPLSGMPASHNSEMSGSQSSGMSVLENSYPPIPENSQSTRPQENNVPDPPQLHSDPLAAIPIGHRPTFDLCDPLPVEGKKTGMSDSLAALQRVVNEKFLESEASMPSQRLSPSLSDHRKMRHRKTLRMGMCSSFPTPSTSHQSTNGSLTADAMPQPPKQVVYANVNQCAMQQASPLPTDGSQTGVTMPYMYGIQAPMAMLSHPISMAQPQLQTQLIQLPDGSVVQTVSYPQQQAQGQLTHQYVPSLGAFVPQHLAAVPQVYQVVQGQDGLMYYVAQSIQPIMPQMPIITPGAAHVVYQPSYVQQSFPVEYSIPRPETVQPSTPSHPQKILPKPTPVPEVSESGKSESRQQTQDISMFPFASVPGPSQAPIPVPPSVPLSATVPVAPQASVASACTSPLSSVASAPSPGSGDTSAEDSGIMSDSQANGRVQSPCLDSDLFQPSQESNALARSQERTQESMDSSLPNNRHPIQVKKSIKPVAVTPKPDQPSAVVQHHRVTELKKAESSGSSSPTKPETTNAVTTPALLLKAKLHEKEAEVTVFPPKISGKAAKIMNGKKPAERTTKAHIVFEVKSQDGVVFKSNSLEEAWQCLLSAVQDARQAQGLPSFPSTALSGLQLSGLSHSYLQYLLEQLPGANECTKYVFRFHQPPSLDQETIPNATGCARTEGFKRNPAQGSKDPFSFLGSSHRPRPVPSVETTDTETLNQGSVKGAKSTELPLAMRYRHMRENRKNAVGVHRSEIHGQGLFSKRSMDAGEMVMEYTGEVIRSAVADIREKIYESKGMGCYMFRVDEDTVIDATMAGSSARFINHSCEPNCYSRVVDILSEKRIIIFASRPIKKGEELTYDYKFPLEEDKIPCMCKGKRCRKYLN
ncbi:unnamed protein product [Darwinula stevensoni]|uniref:Uncharacterized protein n=1 Tax=Darwinula stevensoni TaxID=69355 RepID=A0A7R9ADP0_9CRUS|nr:unnamed protein product [Darwinula stevensoni]CAG0900918.1 unnamed protein product [Darwinula stevensoni]